MYLGLAEVLELGLSITLHIHLSRRVVRYVVCSSLQKYSMGTRMVCALVYRAGI